MGLGRDDGDDNMKKVESIADLSWHNNIGSQDCWLIINSKVYDVTKFLGDHPGGKEVLLEAAGKDASEGFEEAGHGSAARLMLDEFYVREVPQPPHELTDHHLVTAAPTIINTLSSSSSIHDQNSNPNPMMLLLLWGLGLGSLMFAIWWSWTYT